MNELKPCPFCGQRVSLARQWDVYFVRCKCGAMGGVSTDPDKSAEQWNSRYLNDIISESTPNFLSVYVEGGDLG